MAYKNISLSVEAYAALKSLKHDAESFSHEILRLTKKTSVSEVAGILSHQEAEDLRKGVEEVRKAARVRQWR
ncbi:TPA: hypothetical protein HA244_04565 [Candidatus Micrarchaeota archaeon]|nr:hypothetical protein [Candidatus Micrarchaeota archaeon]